MATLNAAPLISGASYFNCVGACNSKVVPSANNAAVHRRPHLHRQKLKSYSGLRSFSVTNSQSDALAIQGHVAKTASKQESRRSKSVIECSGGMSLVFVSAEVSPWSKTGGLGDVLGGLPPAMAARGHRVMTISPRYDQYSDAWDTNVLVQVNVGDRTETVRFFHCHKRGVDRVFVDHPWFLAKVWGITAGKLYGPTTGVDYQDNQLRFSLLCQAALEAPRVLNLNSNQYFSGPYGEDVAFIANDWHTSLLPCYLKSMYKSRGMYQNAKVAFCIHNISYQGRFAAPDFELLNLPDYFRSSFEFTDGYSRPVAGRKINWMQAGILEADKVLTVSPYYAQELTSGSSKGVELDKVICRTGITGIVNGMDVNEWNPETDKYIDVNYDATTVLKAKPVLKEALQAALGLPVDRNIPLFAFIGRLEEQKGSDILVAAVPEFIGENLQLVALGTGKKHMENQIEQLGSTYPQNARGIAKFNAALAHKMLAAADFLLIPSRFEPCGLVQLQGMKYGTVCNAATTGGLADTIRDGFTGFQMGPFNVNCEAVDPADIRALANSVRRSLAIYRTPAHEEMIQNCMAQDFSWKGPARKWEETLLNLGVPGSQPGFEGEEISPRAEHNIARP
ncbi:granule-bound starch synthase 1b, chloroplastic/amyloplastic-like [Nymphaea colorata]|nr:granule-bound starch synthase 1b, chloroplastic/amyloplastic-like [Nymphaea colorata]